jgi:hypothetical protein
MSMVELLKEWITTLLIGAIMAVAGYAWKSWIENRERKRKERAGIISKLEELKSLLDTSRYLFSMQQVQVQRLMESLRHNHPAEYAKAEGYDERMARCFPKLNDDEKALHGIIRAYTQHSMRRVNEAIQRWLDTDEQFKTGRVQSSRKQALADRLRELEMHLLLWQAKLEYWLPANPGHALVYMEDERAHGLGFPSDRVLERDGKKYQIDGVDTEVSRVLRELEGRRH